MLNNKPTKQQINHLHNRPTKGETNWPTYRLTDRPTDRLIKDHIRRQTDQQTDGRLKGTVRKIDRQTLSNGETQNLFNYLSFSWTFILLQSGGNCKDKKISSIHFFFNNKQIKATRKQDTWKVPITKPSKKHTNSEKTICSFHFGSYVFFLTVVLACKISSKNVFAWICFYQN